MPTTKRIDASLLIRLRCAISMTSYLNIVSNTGNVRCVFAVDQSPAFTITYYKKSTYSKTHIINLLWVLR